MLAVAEIEFDEEQYVLLSGNWEKWESAVNWGGFRGIFEEGSGAQ